MWVLNDILAWCYCLQEMLMYHLSPSFEYQDDPWIKWRQAKQPRTAGRGTPKERFIKVAR